MNDIMKIVQTIEDSNILLKGVTKTIKNETKEPKGGFFIYDIRCLRSIFIRKLTIRKGTVRAGEGIVRAGYGSSIKRKALIPPHPLTNFEIKEYYEN